MVPRMPPPPPLAPELAWTVPLTPAAPPSGPAAGKWPMPVTSPPRPMSPSPLPAAARVREASPAAWSLPPRTSTPTASTMARATQISRARSAPAKPAAVRRHDWNEHASGFMGYLTRALEQSACRRELRETPCFACPFEGRGPQDGGPGVATSRLHVAQRGFAPLAEHPRHLGQAPRRGVPDAPLAP